MMVYLPRNEATWAITIQLCEDEIAEFLTKKDKEYLPQPNPALLGSISIVRYGPLASHNPYPIIVYSMANYGPHLSRFWANTIFEIPT